MQTTQLGAHAHRYNNMPRARNYAHTVTEDTVARASAHCPTVLCGVSWQWLL